MREIFELRLRLEGCIELLCPVELRQIVALLHHGAVGHERYESGGGAANDLRNLYCEGPYSLDGARGADLDTVAGGSGRGCGVTPPGVSLALTVSVRVHPVDARVTAITTASREWGEILRRCIGPSFYSKTPTLAFSPQLIRYIWTSWLENMTNPGRSSFTWCFKEYQNSAFV